MPEVLYISYDGMTDPLGQSQVIPYLIGLSKKGYCFTLISAEKAERFHSNKEAVGKILADAGIDWQPVTYTKRPPVLSTLYDYWVIKKLADRLHKQKNFYIVHCRSYISSLVGLWLKKKYGVKFIFDMRGFWADERVDGKLWDIKNPIYRSVYKFFKKKEKHFLENASYTISLTHRAKEEIYKWKHIENNPVPIAVIPCCVDTALFAPDAISPQKKDHWRGLAGIQNGDFVISYLGSIGTWYMLDAMLDFFHELKKEIPGAKFLFITHDEHERIFRVANEKGIRADDIVIRPGKRTEVPALLSLSDYSIFFITPSYSKMSSSPTKMGEIMAMGIPIVCNSGVGDTDEIIKKYEAGFIVHDFMYGDVIARIKSSFPNVKNNNREAAIDYFSLDNGVDSYWQVYKAV
jgi:glycosyltransferase involved in cell wall biosynthesis